MVLIFLVVVRVILKLIKGLQLSSRVEDLNARGRAWYQWMVLYHIRLNLRVLIQLLLARENMREGWILISQNWDLDGARLKLTQSA